MVLLKRSKSLVLNLLNKRQPWDDQADLKRVYQDQSPAHLDPMFLRRQNVLFAMNPMWTVSFTHVDTCVCASNVLSNSGPMQESALFVEQA